eukprot:scaffold6436_cov113-Isochrysis_galbana.AAC.2
MGNKGALLRFDSDLEYVVKQFDAVPHPSHIRAMQYAGGMGGLFGCHGHARAGPLTELELSRGRAMKSLAPGPAGAELPLALSNSVGEPWWDGLDKIAPAGRGGVKEPNQTYGRLNP